jgi:hypothetical protein
MEMRRIKLQQLFDMSAQKTTRGSSKEWFYDRR